MVDQLLYTPLLLGMASGHRRGRAAAAEVCYMMMYYDTFMEGAARYILKVFSRY